MGKPVCMGAMLQCSFGVAPSQLSVVVPLRPKIQNKLTANVMDFVPMANVMPFGMCQSLSNPQVAAATAAAMGALTPMPCIPVLTAPWAPGGQAKVGGMPVLLDNCQTMCAWGGCISIKQPGQMGNAQFK